ncbi:MAG: GntR family transcriptional regulator [Lachnospiraceae bacterium]|nr:GntR family transcriptional regulator [Lachnospiraceae bacterium]
MAISSEIKMDAYLPLRDVVFQTLRQAILKGDLKPGERLMEIQLSHKLGVSRTPIREAIRKLELEGLVLMIPRKGAEVAKITEKTLRDVLEIRLALEQLAVRLACGRMTQEGLEVIKKAAKQCAEVSDTNDVMEVARLDVAFHDAIHEVASNQRLIQMLDNLQEQVYRYRVEYLKLDTTHSQIVKEHQEIIKAIEKGDCEWAVEVTSLHIQNQVQIVSDMLREEG